MASLSYINRRAEARRSKCAAMRAAKERKRMESAEAWQIIREVTLRDPRNGAVHHWTISASPCGRYVDIVADGKHAVCGSERTVRCAIARAMWSARIRPKMTS